MIDQVEIEFQGNLSKGQVKILNGLINSVVKANSYLFTFSKVYIYIEFTELTNGVKATFLPLKSGGNHFHFLFDYALIGSDVKVFSCLLSHELAHAADLAVLSENSAIYQNSIRLNNRFSLDDLKTDISSPKNIDTYSIQWCLLNYIATIRNEGVALLNEVVQGYRELPNIENAQKEFLNSLDFVVDFSRNLHFHKRFDRNRTLLFYASMERSVYTFADAVLLSVLHPGRLEVGENNLTLEDLKHVLIKALSFDVSEWIEKVLFGKYIRDLERNEIGVFSMLKSFGTIALEEDSQIGKKIMAIAANRDRRVYLQMIHRHIENERSYIDLKSELINLERADYKSDLKKATKELAIELLNNIDTNEPSVVIAALNYYLSNEDIISDDVPFIGHHDDWFVLEAGARLL